MSMSRRTGAFLVVIVLAVLAFWASRPASTTLRSAEVRRGEFVERMSAALRRITRAFQPRPVIYRTTDSGPTSSAASRVATGSNRSRPTR